MTTLTPPRCILFDLDGTLVDSVADISASANYVRESLGMETLPEAELTRYVGDGAVMLIRRALAGRRDAPEEFKSLDFRTELKKFRSHYHEHCLENTTPFDGVVETLAALAPMPMAIVSNKPEPMCKTIADGLGLKPYLGAVVGARNGVPVKPDPALLIAALEELGVDSLSDGSSAEVRARRRGGPGSRGSARPAAALATRRFALRIGVLVGWARAGWG